MASAETSIPSSESQSRPIENLAGSVADLSLHDDAGHSDTSEKLHNDDPPRPLTIYTPAQILYLHASPLVQPPKGMPDLKDWFGMENEQNLNKKELENASQTNNPRDRRFRRDLDDGDASSRPSFRSAMTQPSQMGNFKHQSLRGPDRDRDRDLRDKEGHEHLRNLSDKFDRDRLGSNNRSKDRDTAPHLSTAGTSRLVGPGQPNSAASKRTDASKKDDWRRVNDRGTRDDRSDTTRRDRDRPRSRVRDTSRQRRDPSQPRRDRDRDQDRYRDEYRHDAYDRDTDRGSEQDDPRRWRDDGRRDERMAARRLAERERDRERAHEYNAYRAGQDDNRGKRQLPRDRKANGNDEKERDDRRDREREKEKEPAWMDTYIPSTNGGTLGNGELDGIQAWKKDMKEKQEKQEEKEKEKEKEKLAAKSVHEDAPPVAASKPVAGANGLDEIQMFRMLMKQEEEKKRQGDTPDDSNSTAKPIVPALGASIDTVKATTVTSNNTAPISVPSTAETPNTLLAMLTNSASTINSSLDPPIRAPPEKADPAIAAAPFPPAAPNLKVAEPSLNPPPGSRLLAFARSPVTDTNKSNSPIPASPQTIQEQPNYSPVTDMPPSGASKPHPRAPTFSPFKEASRSPFQDPTDPASLRRVSAERAPPFPSENGRPMESPLDPSASVALASSKGSRFAKFFDGNKSRDPAIARAQPATGPPSGLAPIPRGDENSGSPMNPNPDNRAMVEIFNMLHNSVQDRSLGGMEQPLPLGSRASFQQQPPNIQMVQQLQHQQAPLPSSRLHSLYDSRLDDRSFVPDGMVPGLRNAPPIRGQDNGMFHDGGVDEFHYARQRMASQQQRAPDHMFPNQIPMFSQQPHRNVGPPLQQPQYRGGPSPIPLQNPVQRLPPGLANLGGRPPHEPNQYLGMANAQNAGLINALHGNGLSQTQFNNLPNANNVGFGAPPIRAPAPSSIQNNMAHNSIGLGHPNNMDMRLANQNHLMNIGGIGGMRNGTAFNQGPGQIQQQPLMGMRQQQPPMPLPHHGHHINQGLPAHLQQQALPPSNPQNHDLMALLMGGLHRE